MKFMTAEELKRRASSVIDEVYKTGEEVTITKDGEHVATLLPFREQADEISHSKPRRKKSTDRKVRRARLVKTI